MTKDEIRAEIRRLNKLLEGYEKSRKNAEDKQEELFNAIDKISAKSREISDGLEKTMGNIETRLGKVNGNSRFPAMYRAAARAALFNQKSSDAVSSCGSALKAAGEKSAELDKEIEEFSGKISRTENEIASLKAKLNDAED